ncbi:MAG: ABC transporter permease [Spirochaetaceae bacterium]|jgi:putative ABC transport system permease protein|nr:ABC transporter permease [Spirochaetaceae bacterium]
MFEDLVFAFRMFKRAKTRTMLSLLGVIIGVASVIIIGTLGESATGNVKKTFESANLNMIQVTTGYMRRARENRIEFNEAFRNELFETIQGIKKIWFKNSMSSILLNKDLSYSCNIDAVDYGYIETCGLKLEKGRYFNVSDTVEGFQVVILGSKAAEALFPDGNELGQQVLVQSSEATFGFRVIGVLKGQVAGFESPELSVYVPRGFYQKKVDRRDLASITVVEALKPGYVSSIIESIKNFAARKTGDSFALSTNSMQAMLEQIDQVTGTMSLLLSGIAAISLLVGGIGIMNIMIVTVTERKKEIGIRKAIGASPRRIRFQFLIESAAITIAGGILGIVAGLGISALVVSLLGWKFSFAVLTCVLSFLFSAIVGVFFGFYPASRAAKLDPVMALSAE